MSDRGNPFWLADATPDRLSTAIVAVLFWLAMAGALIAFAPSLVSALLAFPMAFQAFRTWRRFRAAHGKILSR